MPEDLSAHNLTGIATADKETLTISTGDITVTKKLVIINSTANLDGIVVSSILSPGDADGAEFYLMADAGKTVTIRHNQNAAAAKNILTESGASITLTGNAVVRVLYNIALDTNGASVVTVTHAEDHDHDGSPTQKLLAANTHETPSATTHHTKYTDAEALSAAPAVTLAGTPDYITISGQVITRAKIDLTSSSIVDGVLPEANLPNASETAEGVVELATAAEINTGDATELAMTPKAFADSNFGVRYFTIQVFPTGTTQTTGVKKFILHIPPGLNGMDLVYVHMEQTTAGTVGSLLTVDINNNGATMLSTKLTCDVGETGSDTAAAAVIDTGADGVLTNDVISGDVDGLHDTAGVGLLVTLGLQLP